MPKRLGVGADHTSAIARRMAREGGMQRLATSREKQRVEIINMLEELFGVKIATIEKNLLSGVEYIASNYDSEYAVVDLDLERGSLKLAGHPADWVGVRAIQKVRKKQRRKKKKPSEGPVIDIPPDKVELCTTFVATDTAFL